MPLLNSVYPGASPLNKDWGRCNPGPLRHATHWVVVHVPIGGLALGRSGGTVSILDDDS